MKNANKKVIVVRGSEDGVLGVATNLKKAVEIANGNGYEATYQETLREVNDFRKRTDSAKDETFIATIYTENRTHVNFESFYLNA